MFWTDLSTRHSEQTGISCWYVPPFGVVCLVREINGPHGYLEKMVFHNVHTVELVQLTVFVILPNVLAELLLKMNSCQMNN